MLNAAEKSNCIIKLIEDYSEIGSTAIEVAILVVVESE
jgi:hypothetical protein